MIVCMSTMPHRLLSALVACCVFAPPASAAYRSVCHVVLEDCLGAYNGTSISVPTDAVAVHHEIPNCPPDVDFVKNVPASIMLLIDDSNSTLWSDPGAVRFEVLDSLIEIISRTQPAARLGAAVFTGKLAWNVEGSNDNGILQPLGQDRSNAYLPIKPLTEQVNGRAYKDILKEYLRKDPQANQFASWTNTRASGTDITLAFEAARDAFSNNQYSQGSRFDFIIFLSDGEAAVTDPARQATEHDYRTCDKMTDVPAAFTVFLSSGPGEPPPELTEMTDCIRGSGYSSSNTMSDVWSVVSNEKDKFLSVMRDEILYDISSVQVDAGVALKSAVVGGVGFTAQGSNMLVAQKPIPLEPTVTTLSYALTYSYTGPSGSRDTVMQGSFTIARSEGASWPALTAHKIGRKCYERSLSISSNGAPIVAGEVIVKGQTPIVVDAKVEGASGAPRIDVASRFRRDAVPVSTNTVVGGGADEFRGSFEHVINPAKPSLITKLELDYDDRIVVTWRNPDIPLDTIQVENAFSSTPIPPFEYTVNMSSNPTDFSGTVETTKGVQRTYRGAVIAIHTDLPDDSIQTEIAAASATIYDAVGNVIAELVAGREDMGGAYAYLPWDGTNRSGRRTGTGTYLAIVEVTLRDTESGIETLDLHRVMLGVKR